MRSKSGHQYMGSIMEGSQQRALLSCLPCLTVRTTGPLAVYSEASIINSTHLWAKAGHASLSDRTRVHVYVIVF